MARLRLADSLLDRLPGQVSGGELQRFALVRTLLLDPVFLFADEATSRLDPVSQREVVEFLLEIVSETGPGRAPGHPRPRPRRSSRREVLRLAGSGEGGAGAWSGGLAVPA